MITYRDIKPNGFVDLWDLGPSRPIPPDPPPLAPAKTGNAADDVIAKLEQEDRIAAYERDLRAYGAVKKEFDRHQQHVGGPRKARCGRPMPAMCSSASRGSRRSGSAMLRGQHAR